MKHQKYLYFLIVLLIYSIIYLPLIISGRMYIYLDIGADTYSSYWPNYAFAYRYLQSLPMEGWSFNLGLGSSIVNLIPFIFDPFTIFILLFEKINIECGIFLAATAKVFTLAILAYSYLGKMGYKGISQVIAALCYTFSGYFIGWGQHYHFATAFIMFTLILLCFEQWIKTSRIFGFVISIAILAAYSPYFLYMSMMFFLIYQLFRNIQLHKSAGKLFIMRSISTVLLSLLGFGLSAFSLLPQTYNLLESPRVSAQQLPIIGFASLLEYYSMYMRLFSNSILGIQPFHGYQNFYESPFLYTSVLMLFLLPYLFKSGRKFQLKYFIFIVCLLALLFPSISNPIFNGFSGYTYRWTFIFVPISSIAIAESLKTLSSGNKPWWHIIILFSCIIALFFGFLSYNATNTGRIKYALPISLIILCLFSILYTLLFLVILPKAKKNHFSILLLICVALELALSGYVSVNLRNVVSRQAKDNIPYFNLSTIKAINLLSIDQDFYRINKLYDYIDLKDAYFQDFYGEKDYSSMFSGQIWQLQDAFGLLGANSNYLFGFSDRQSLRDISSGKYMLSPTNFDFAGYRLINKVGDIFIYENQNAYPLGFTYNNYITLKNFYKLGSLERQNLLYDSVILDNSQDNIPRYMNEVNLPSIEADLLETAYEISYNDLSVIEENFPNYFHFNTTGIDPQIIIILPQKTNSSISIMFDLISSSTNLGEIYYAETLEEINQYNKIPFEIKKGIHDYHFTVMANNIRFIRVDPSNTEGEFSVANFEIFKRDDTKISYFANKLSKNQIEFDISSNNKFEGSIELEKGGMIYLSIPFDPGWEIRANDTKVRTVRANLAFTGFFLDPGYYRISMNYRIPWFREGLRISIISFFILLILILIRYWIQLSQKILWEEYS